jgi:hypothetical protein
MGNAARAGLFGSQQRLKVEDRQPFTPAQLTSQLARECCACPACGTVGEARPFRRTCARRKTQVGRLRWRPHYSRLLAASNLESAAGPIEPICQPGRLMNWSNWGAAHVFAWKCICAARCGLPLSHRRRTYSCNVRRLFPLSLLVDAAKRQRECRTGRLSAAAQDRRALCRLPVGTSRSIGGVSDTGNSRTSTRDRKA